MENKDYLIARLQNEIKSRQEDIHRAAVYCKQLNEENLQFSSEIVEIEMKNKDMLIVRLKEEIKSRDKDIRQTAVYYKQLREENLQILSKIEKINNQIEELHIKDYAANHKVDDPRATGAFGNTSQQTGFFGMTPATSSSFFCNTTQSKPLFATTGTTRFDSTQISGGLLGNTAQTSTPSSGGLFDGNTSAFGTPHPTFCRFGTDTSGRLFGFGQSASTRASIFGSSGFTPSVQSGTTFKFNPPTGTDTMMKGEVSTDINTRHQCITCMKEYKQKSFEELRIEDYAANRKGGGPGTIGNASQQTGLFVFGTPPAASSSFFCNTSQSKPLFGTTGTTRFDSTQTSDGLLGNTAQTSTPSAGGIFDVNASAFRAPLPTFGAFGTHTSGSRLFGQNASNGASPFGSSGFTPTVQRGTTFKFNPPTGTDTMMKGEVSTDINTRHQCITCMKEYEQKSFEELRIEDYATCKGGPGAIGAFGNTSQQPGLFGTTPAASSSLFCNTTQSKPLFGTTGATRFDLTQTSGGLLGNTAQTSTPSSGGIFGVNTSAFGAPLPTFGAFGTHTSASGLFGQNASNGASPFGSSGFTSTVQSGTTVKFNPLTGTDTMTKGGVSTDINTMHQCITSMKEYQNKSLEELRFEDYATNHKGGGKSGAFVAFGNTSESTGLFGTTPAASSFIWHPLFGAIGTLSGPSMPWNQPMNPSFPVSTPPTTSVLANQLNMPTTSMPLRHNAPQLQSIPPNSNIVSQSQNTMNPIPGIVNQSNKLRQILLNQLPNMGLRMTNTSPGPVVSSTGTNPLAAQLGQQHQTFGPTSQPVSQQSISMTSSVPSTIQSKLASTTSVNQMAAAMHSQTMTTTSASNTTLPQSVNQGMTMNASQQPNQSPSNSQATKDSCTIWQGILEFMEKSMPAANQPPAPRVSHSLPCTFSPMVTNGDPGVNADKWPGHLMLQLIPRQLIVVANLFTLLKTATRHVLIHFNQESESLSNLCKLMSSGLVGCIQFPQHCNIRIMVVLYMPDKKVFMGFIPNDQDYFFHSIRQVYETHRKQQQQLEQRMQQLGSNIIPSDGMVLQPSSTTTTQNIMMPQASAVNMPVASGINPCLPMSQPQVAPGNQPPPQAEPGTTMVHSQQQSCPSWRQPGSRTWDE